MEEERKSFTVQEQKKALEREQAKPVRFVNFSDEDFTYTYDSTPYTFPTGKDKYLTQGIAEHFAKHLINRELHKAGRDSDTSPKNPKDSVFYMELWNKCIFPMSEEGEIMDETKSEMEILDASIRARKEKVESKTDNSEKEEEFEEVPVDDN